MLSFSHFISPSQIVFTVFDVSQTSFSDLRVICGYAENQPILHKGKKYGSYREQTFSSFENLTSSQNFAEL